MISCSIRQYLWLISLAIMPSEFICAAVSGKILFLFMTKQYSILCVCVCVCVCMWKTLSLYVVYVYVCVCVWKQLSFHIYVYIYIYACAKLLPSCPFLCDLMDYSFPCSSVHGILQVRILEWVAMPFSRAFSWPRDWTCISCVFCIAGQVLYH